MGTNGGCVGVGDLADAVAVANRYAPEHLQVAVADDEVDQVVDGLVNAGEILVGQHTPFSAANFVIGCPASLPTSGFAEVSSGITVEAFLKRTAIARADERAVAADDPDDRGPRGARGVPGPRRGAAASIPVASRWRPPSTRHLGGNLADRWHESHPDGGMARIPPRWGKIR